MTACSGPQSVQQMVIGLCTGHFPWEIQVSTLISLLSLSWGASRAFFVERIPDEADPDPAVLMVLMRIFPLMLIVVTNSMLTWIAIGGLIGTEMENRNKRTDANFGTKQHKNCETG